MTGKLLQRELSWGTEREPSDPGHDALVLEPGS